MLRIGFVSPMRSLGHSGFVQAARQPSIQTFRFYSILRSNVLSSSKRPNPTIFTLPKQSRTFLTDAKPIVYRPAQSEAWKRYAITAVSTDSPFPLHEELSCSSSLQAAVAGTIVATNAFLNRETRDALSTAERSYLHESFQYTGGGLAITAIVARAMFKNGVAFRIMSANPWVVLGVSLVGSIGTMMGAMYTPPENTVLKHAFWLVSNPPAL